MARPAARPPDPPHVAASHALAAREPAVAQLLERFGPCPIGATRPRRSHFAELTRIVCSQQLAGAAARAIHARVEARLGGRVTPDAVLALPPDALHGAGLSAAKAAAIVDLAARVDRGDLRLGGLGRVDDAEVVRRLVTVRGIGPWSAEMFCMFQLGRLDVWPVGDLGVRMGYARIAGLDRAPSPRALEPLGERFRPYRSVAAWYCWRAVDASA